MQKKEIMAAIRKYTKELGHCPSLGELTERARVSRRDIGRLFGSYGMAVRACGMEPAKGSPTKVEDLFADWAKVTRKLGKLPTIFEYEQQSMYSSKPLISRFKGWRQVPTMMQAYAERQKLEGKWGNELGVVFLFGMVARQRGFVVMRIQMGFPDCEAMRKIDEQTWQMVRIEFEHESRNFLRHGHPPSGCDLIVCWIHNWPECPVEVLELSKMEW